MLCVIRCIVWMDMCVCNKVCDIDGLCDFCIVVGCWIWSEDVHHVQSHLLDGFAASRRL